MKTHAGASQMAETSGGYYFDDASETVAREDEEGTYVVFCSYGAALIDDETPTEERVSRAQQAWEEHCALRDSHDPT